MRDALVDTLIQEEIITAETVALDFTPILANVKENNLKTSVKDRFDKNRRPKRDLQAGLGIMVHYPRPFKKKARSFWDYRDYTAVVVDTELSLWEKTLPADKSEIRQAIPLLKKLIERHSLLGIEAVLGDIIYDTEDILKFIIKELKAKAAIPRRSPGENKTQDNSCCKPGRDRNEIN